MTTGKRCCDILAQERAKRARKEKKIGTVPSLYYVLGSIKKKNQRSICTGGNEGGQR